MTNQNLNSASTNPPPRLPDDSGAHAGGHRLVDPKPGRTDTSHDRTSLEYSKPETDLRPSRTALEYRRSERGFTLQTLIILAIFVVLATIAGVVIVALTTSSGDSFEDAGRSDVGEAGTSSGFTDGGRRPNEIRDPALESMGLRGVIQDFPLEGHWNGKESQNIGYRPYCPPWEYLTKGPNEKGEYEYDPTAATEANIGGPEGAGGVYSSKPGCFAPCYFNFTAGGGRGNGPDYVISNESSLSYFDDNRAPEQYQVRLGVIYRRISETAWNALTPLTQQRYINAGTDVETLSLNSDGKPYISTWRNKVGAEDSPGLPWLPSLNQPEPEVPTIFIPNFLANRAGNDPGVIARNNDRRWIDENWEYRADPINRTCTIVNVTLDDQPVCSSEWQNCASRPS